MMFQFGGNPEMDKIQYWFQFFEQTCREHFNCDGCPLIAGAPHQTDIGVLQCRTGSGRKPRSNNDEATGRTDNTTN